MHICPALNRALSMTRPPCHIDRPRQPSPSCVTGPPETPLLRSFQALDPAFVEDQFSAVFDDLRIDEVKIGMIVHAGVARADGARLA